MYKGLGWVGLHGLVAGFVTYWVGSVRSGLMDFHTVCQLINPIVRKKTKTEGS